MVNIRLSYEPLYGKLLGVALHSRIGDSSTEASKFVAILIGDFFEFGVEFWVFQFQGDRIR